MQVYGLSGRIKSAKMLNQVQHDTNCALDGLILNIIAIMKITVQTISEGSADWRTGVQYVVLNNLAGAYIEEWVIPIDHRPKPIDQFLTFPTQNHSP